MTNEKVFVERYVAGSVAEKVAVDFKDVRPGDVADFSVLGRGVCVYQGKLDGGKLVTAEGILTFAFPFKGVISSVENILLITSLDRSGLRYDGEKVRGATEVSCCKSTAVYNIEGLQSLGIGATLVERVTSLRSRR